MCTSQKTEFYCRKGTDCPYHSDRCIYTSTGKVVRCAASLSKKTACSTLTELANKQDRDDRCTRCMDDDRRKP